MWGDPERGSRKTIGNVEECNTIIEKVIPREVIPREGVERPSRGGSR
jgi:hypothetical protein